MTEDEVFLKYTKIFTKTAKKSASIHTYQIRLQNGKFKMANGFRSLLIINDITVIVKDY